MKKSLFALAAFTAFAGAAQAQSSVTLYGVLDAGVGTINNVYASGQNKSWTGMTTGNLATSRWGVKGSEDLGGGLSANFRLESQFFPNTGESGSTSLYSTATTSQTTQTGTASASSSVSGPSLFDRNATVGFSGAFGSVDIGRQNNVMYDKLIAYDPMSYGNFGGLGSTGVNKTSRVNNSIKYASPVNNGFSFNALVSNAGTAGKIDAGSYLEGAVNYSQNNLNLTAAYSQAKTNCAGNVPNGAATPDQAYCTFFGTPNSGSTAQIGDVGYKHLLLAGNYTFGDFLLSGGWLRRSDAAAQVGAKQNDVSLTWLGVAYTINPVSRVIGAYYSVNDKTAAGKNPSLTSVSYQYSLSKRTMLYANAAYVAQDSASSLTVADNGKVNAGNANNGLLPVTGTNQTGYTVGVKHNF